MPACQGGILKLLLKLFGKSRSPISFQVLKAHSRSSIILEIHMCSIRNFLVDCLKSELEQGRQIRIGVSNAANGMREWEFDELKALAMEIYPDAPVMEMFWAPSRQRVAIS